MDKTKDKTKYRTLIYLGKSTMKDYINEPLMLSGALPHTYDGVDAVVDVLDRVMLRNHNDLTVEVEWMLREWMDDSGYLVVPEKFIRIPPLPWWW